MTALLRSFWIGILTVIVAVPLDARGEGDTLALRLLPSRHRVHDFVADGTAHRFSATQLLSPHEVQLSVGGILPLVDYSLWGVPIQVSSGASIHARLDPGRSIAVLSTEFSVDFFLLDVQLSEDLIVRTGMSHASHHLGDGPAGDSTALPFDYSRDEVQMFIIHASPFLPGQVYVGARYAYALVIRQPVGKPLSLQIGMHALILAFSQELSLYAGWDLKMHQELSSGTSQRYETGLQYRSETGRILRLAISYSAGLDERGQFFGKRRNEAGIGIVVSL
ncbi:MAG: DUF1207 domain-containing protein [Bacteroidota bacterium]